ncbi:MAG: MBOAT family protein [Planctomycetes bacterium]|jgi:D-alanyl-lipoteichoic acid acyltransferase DltB (MBOAT superfamily)|nr:MBOAT family protein [Planctomycetota bacterium]
MVFSSYLFILVFLPVVLIGYATVLRCAGMRYAIGWLVGCSLVYYGSWNPPYLLLLGGSVVGNYFFGLALSRRVQRPGGKAILALGVAANLALLGYFKYAGFLTDAVAALFGQAWDAGRILLPLAISFFTFQQIAYLVDVYRGETREHRFLDYCLFVTFFPQLIAGPIVHHREMLPQFHARGFRGRAMGLHPRNLSVGLVMFVFGLAKKVLIADEMADDADRLFAAAAAGQTPGAMWAWYGSVCYAMQIYFDFSGYSDMAIGVARMFGIRLPVNFNSPYKATGAIEFWRRWHITLSRFLRDYLYIPLGGNRRGKARRHLNLMIVMLLGGLWHGAGWTFVAWGGLHGLYLIINHAWRAARARRRGGEPTPTPLGVALSTAITFVGVVIAWVLFRAESFDAAQRILMGMFGVAGELPLPRSADAGALVALGVVLCVAFFVPNSQELLRAYRPVLGKRPVYTGPRWMAWMGWKPDLPGAIIVALLAVYCLVQIARGSPFIYYQF